MSLDILAGFFLIFYTQCINAGAYFSGDTTITAFDNKTRSIQELKVLDQVLIIPNLALRKPEPANNNLAIDSTSDTQHSWLSKSRNPLQGIAN